MSSGFPQLLIWPLIGFGISDCCTNTNMKQFYCIPSLCWERYYATVFGRFFAPLGAGLCLFAAVSRG